MQKLSERLMRLFHDRQLSSKILVCGLISMMALSLLTATLRLAAEYHRNKEQAARYMQHVFDELQPLLDQVTEQRQPDPLKSSLERIIQRGGIDFARLVLTTGTWEWGSAANQAVLERRFNIGVADDEGEYQQWLSLQYNLQPVVENIWSRWPVAWFIQFAEALLIVGLLLFIAWRLSGRNTATVSDEREDTVAQLAFLERFSCELAELSAGLMNLSVERVDESIDHALERITTICEADKCCLWLWSENAEQLSSVYHWADPALPEHYREGDESNEGNEDFDTLVDIALTQLSWLKMRVDRGIPVQVLDIEQLPDEANDEYEWLVSGHVRAFVMLPVRFAARVYGCLGLFVMTERCHWLGQDPALLRVAGDLLSGALQNREQQQRLIAANSQLQVLSEYDELTGIANRFYFNHQIQRIGRLAARTGQPVTMVLVNIDCFKSYNDCYGHIEGDKTLRAVAQCIDKAFRRADEYVARFGGEEFAVICGTSSDPQAIFEQAQRFRQQVVELAIPHQGSTVADCVTVSIGVACLSLDDAEQYRQLMELADACMFRAKANGRNCVVFEDEYGVEHCDI